MSSIASLVPCAGHRLRIHRLGSSLPLDRLIQVFYGMRGAISTKKKIPRAVNTARTVPIVVRRLTTAFSLFGALLSARKKTIQESIVAIRSVTENWDAAALSASSRLHSPPPIKRNAPMNPNQLIHQIDSTVPFSDLITTGVLLRSSRPNGRFPAAS